MNESLINQILIGLITAVIVYFLLPVLRQWLLDWPGSFKNRNDVPLIYSEAKNDNEKQHTQSSKPPNVVASLINDELLLEETEEGTYPLQS